LGLRYRHSEDVVTRQIVGETLLVPIRGDLAGSQRLFALDAVGEFIWHHHEDEDEFFMVHKGEMTIQLRDRVIHLDEGEFFIVPRGIEHKPVAEHECQILLFEPQGTLNTGNLRTSFTQDDLENI